VRTIEADQTFMKNPFSPWKYSLFTAPQLKKIEYDGKPSGELLEAAV